MMMMTMIIKKKKNSILMDYQLTKEQQKTMTGAEIISLISCKCETWKYKYSLQKETICQMMMVTSIRKDNRADRGER